MPKERRSRRACRFAANAAWLAVQVMAHNLARWTARVGLGEQLITTKTLRRRFFSMAGRLTRSARRLTLHLPERRPWAVRAPPLTPPAGMLEMVLIGDGPTC